MDGSELWTVGQRSMAVLFVVLAVFNLTQLAWTPRRKRLDRGVNLVNAVLQTGLASNFFALSTTPLGPGSDPRNFPGSFARWLLVVALIVALLSTPGVLRARSAHIVGAEMLTDPQVRWQGATAAARARDRLDRTLRTAANSGDAAPAIEKPWQRLAAVLHDAATHTGRGDLAAATRAIDDQLAAPDRTPAELGLLLYHRSVYACLGAMSGTVASDPGRVRSDLDIARSLLPDTRLGWLGAAASAAAEGRWAAVPYSTGTLLRSPRGPWEGGLALFLAALASPPDQRTSIMATLAATYPWLTGLVSQAQSSSTGQSIPDAS